MSLTYQRIRLELESSAPLDTSLILEQRTRQRARAGVGRALRFEVAIVKSGIITSDAGDLTSLTLILKPLTTAGVIDGSEDSLLEKTVSTINTLLTQDQWDNDQTATPWHAEFSFADSETVIDMTGATNNELAVGIVVTGITAAGRVTLGSGIITLVDDGAVVTGGAAPTPTRTMTDQEIMAALASKVGFTGNPNGAQIFMPSAAGKNILIWAQDETDGSVTFKAGSVT